ncbi:amino acid oxidoreductase [Jannaschia pagri]|uniref:Amino acid oxidoreductase n=1 Tax=Jannaschia pagri TaxID=2829797 RepID=A0ABQ4NHL7_9RHOB|nr:amino acid oxidoreductase [Jannaschia sp. AI_61]GIT93902.1 amino acid oxidoreductase [Jannaschia sp. AI_62]
MTLLDKETPAQQTSRWNAGVLATSSVIPLNNPALFSDLPRLVTGRHPGFRVHLRSAPRLLPWAIRFLNNSRRSRSERSIRALTELIGYARTQHDLLTSRAGFDGLEAKGWLILYRGREGIARATSHSKRLHDRDVAAEVVTPADIARLEPTLRPCFGGGVHVTGAAHADPRALGRAYVDLAVLSGVTLRQASVSGLSKRADGWRVALSDGEDGPFDHVVLALGPWTNDLLAPLGPPLPLAVERGYVQIFASAGALVRPFFDVDGGYVAAPRPGGIQISTGTELTHLNSPPSPSMCDAAVAAARDALAFGTPAQATPAVGNRPTLPDSLPAIGPIRRHPGLWVAAGHQHIGFSTSAGTGGLLADLIEGRPPAIDPRPYAPGRFGL